MRSPLKSGLRGYCSRSQASTNAFAAVDGPLDVGDRHRPAGAAPLIRAVDAMLHPLEVRQHVLVAPALRAKLLPAVVIGRRAAQEHQSVDRARSAKHLAARPDDLSAVEARLRLGLDSPSSRSGSAPACRTPSGCGSTDCGRARRPRSHTARCSDFRSAAPTARSRPSLRRHHDIVFSIETGFAMISFCEDLPVGVAILASKDAIAISDFSDPFRKRALSEPCNDHHH